MHHMVFVHSKMHSAMQSKLLLQSRVHVELLQQWYLQCQAGHTSSPGMTLSAVNLCHLLLTKAIVTELMTPGYQVLQQLAACLLQMRQASDAACL